MRTLAVYPVNTVYARYLAEMLGIMGDYGQPQMTSSNSYKNIEFANSQTLGRKCVTYVGISSDPIFNNGQYGKGIQVSVSRIKPFIVD